MLNFAEAPNGMRRRVFQAGLVFVVASAVALVLLGLRAIRQQRDAIRSLSASNALLAADRIVTEIESRAAASAQRCLRDAMASGLAAASPADARRIAAAIESRHPIAAQLLVLERRGMRYPRLRPAILVPAAAPGGLWEQAEREELLVERTEAAAGLYRQCLDAAESDDQRARALARIARCYRKLGRAKDAAGTYRTLLTRYGDESDPFGRPYALVAALELGETDARLYRDLAGGRWDIDAETAGYFITRLGRGDGGGLARRFHVAAAFGRDFQPAAGMETGETHPYAFEGRQAFVSAAPTGAFLALIVDLDWIKGAVFPDARGSVPVALVSRKDARVPFKTLFPFWGLTLPAAADSGGDRMLFPAAVLLSLAILVSGLWMVLRDVRREAATNQLRADFVDAVSHELKTPLAVIRLYADTLMDPRGIEAPRRAGFLRGIADQCAKLTRMVENVLDFSRIDRGRKEYRMEPAALGEIVEEILGAYRPVWRGQGFDVEIRIEPDLPQVRIDREAVARAVLNVIENAVKYSEDSRYLGISLSKEDGTVALAIEDRGIGIAPQDRKKIFENFYRARNDSGKGGYGLGLYLVRHVMEAHGGRVEVESEVGKGSLFRLVFPICERS